MTGKEGSFPLIPSSFFVLRYNCLMLAHVRSMTTVGLSAVPIDVEVDLSQGLPGLTIVGLPDKAVE